MAHRIQLSIAVVGLLLVGACGLDVVGIDPIASAVGPDGSAPSTPGDASTTPGAEGGRPDLPADCSNATCTPLAASGFTTIAIGDAAAGCPNGFDAADALAVPTAKNGSCECDACTTTGSTCSTGKVPSSYSSSNSCAIGASPFEANNGDCVNGSGFWASTYGGVTAPPAKVGTCKATAHGVRANVDTQAKRVCTPRATTCAAAMCALPTGLQMCLVAPGDVPCPDGAKEKLVIGGDVTMTCGDCSCTPSATCSGKLHWWASNASCSGTESGVVPAGVCTRVDQANIDSYRWEGIPTETCAAAKPPQKADVSLAAARTVCCPKK